MRIVETDMVEVESSGYLLKCYYKIVQAQRGENGMKVKREMLHNSIIYC